MFIIIGPFSVRGSFGLLTLTLVRLFGIRFDLSFPSICGSVKTLMVVEAIVQINYSIKMFHGTFNFKI